MSNCLLPDEAHAVWDLLVEKAGADPRDRDAFVRYLTEPMQFMHEYRFQGLLGFGGKLHRNGNGVYISCYPEDRNEVRNAIAAAVNARLDEMLSGVRR